MFLSTGLSWSWLLLLLLWIGPCWTFEALRLHHQIIHSQNHELRRSDPAVVILHGLLGSSRNFQSWSKLLYQKLEGKYDVISLDLRNHGVSNQLHGFRPINYKLMADDVKYTLDSLSVRNYHVIGHSMGGKVAANLALSSPSSPPLSLTLLDICPVSYSRDELESVVSCVDKLMELNKVMQSTAFSKKEIHRLIADSFSESTLALFLQASLISNDIHETIDNKSTYWTWSFQLPAISQHLEDVLLFPLDDHSSTQLQSSDVPTLILKGGNSKYVKSQHLPQICKLFSRYSIASIKDASHWLHIEQPQASVDQVTDFLLAATASYLKPTPQLSNTVIKSLVQ